MSTEIKLTHEEDDGTVDLEAKYEPDESSPHLVRITDDRYGSEERKMIFEYDPYSNTLGLVHINNQEITDNTIPNIIDSSTEALIFELYDEDITITEWSSRDQIIRFTRNHIKRAIRSVRSLLPSR